MLERGQRITSILTIYKLSKSLKISPTQLFEPETFTLSVKDKNLGYFTEKNALYLDRICVLLKNKSAQDKELALKILKKLFSKK